MTRFAILFGLVALYAGAVVVFLNGPARSQEVTTFEDDRIVGRLVIHNHLTAPVQSRTVHDFGGVEVIVDYVSTPNFVAGTDPRDIVTITVPDGYLAIPSDVLLPEGESVEILIYEAVLG
jgi:hypothetical protein